MKSLLFTCCVLVAALSHAKAQVSTIDFNNQTNQLNIAISKSDSAAQNTFFQRLDQLMRLQIDYRNARCKNLPIQYQQDSIKAAKALSDANDAYKKEMAKPATTNPEIKAKQNWVAEAEKKVAAAQVEVQSLAMTFHTAIANNISSLATEQNIKPHFELLNTNIPANKNSIDSDLKQFAATL